MEINKLAKECQLRKEKYIDASIGVLKNNRHKIITFKVIEELMKNNINNITSNYSSILGSEEFNLKMCDWIFKRKINAYYSSGYVMGATAGLSFAFYKYSYNKMIVPSLRWPNYDLILKKNKVEFIEYELFDKRNRFNIYEIKKILEKNKEDISLLINDPCSNPTGYTLTISEWENLLKVIKEESIQRKITLILDLAYLDFSFTDYRKVFDLIEKNLSINFNAIICYSFSKSFSLYGYRGGLVIGLFCSNKEKEIFTNDLKFYIRSTWSSSNNLLTTVFVKIMKNRIYRKLIEIKQKQNKLLLKNRMDYFNKVADFYRINHYELNQGFFVFLKVVDANKTYDYLASKNIFVVPFENGIRIAISSINKKEILLILKEINNINSVI